MKKHLYFLMSVCVLFVSSQAFAQLKPWSKMLIFDGAYAMVSSDETSTSLQGYAFGLGFEQANLKGNMAGGFGVMYLNTQETNEERDLELNYSSVPLLLYGKYFIGKPGLTGYLQGGFGIQFSSVEYSGPAVYLKDSDSGLAFNLGAGAHVSLNEKMFLNVAYNFMLMGNSYYQDGMVHLFKLGLGFKYE
jgi:opacity protein-like surface antigen